MKNAFYKKIILYMSAALILVASPISALAAEETTPPNEILLESAGENISVTMDLPADNTATPLPESADNGGITPMQATVYAATNTLNVRSGPSTNHNKIGTLKYGQAVLVTGITADNWYQIQFDGSIGYVLADYVSTTPIENVQTPPAATQTDTPTQNDTITQDTPAANPENDIPTDTAPFTQTEDESAEYDDVTGSLIGAPIVIILAIAIFGVLGLIGFSVYSLFKKDTMYPDDEYYDNEYYEDEYYSDDGQYSDDEEYETEYYPTEQYYTYENDEDDDFQTK